MDHHQEKEKGDTTQLGLGRGIKKTDTEKGGRIKLF
jgi:hypothetical protein